MKTPQWITAGVAFCIVLVLFIFGKTLPPKKINIAKPETNQVVRAFGFDTLLSDAKRHLNNDQVIRLNNLENSLPDRQSGISRGDGKQQQLQVYHQLAHFWGDTAGRFEIYAWYEAEAARLENSEKKLTFAAHLFLDNLQTDEISERRQWKAVPPSLRPLGEGYTQGHPWPAIFLLAGPPAGFGAL